MAKTWNTNADKEFANNLRLDLAAMDDQTLLYAKDILWDDLFTYGSQMRPTTRASKQLRLETIREILRERGYEA